MLKAVRNILFIALLVLLLDSTSSFLVHFREMTAFNYHSPVLVLRLHFILYLLSGIIIGLFAHLSDHYHQPGVWHFDSIRFLTLALPCLFLSSGYLFAYTPIYQVLFHFPFIYLQNLGMDIIIILAGYFIITCLHKKPITLTDIP